MKTDKDLVYRVLKQSNGKFTIVCYLKMGEGQAVQEFYVISSLPEKDLNNFFEGRRHVEHDNFFTSSDRVGTWH